MNTQRNPFSAGRWVQGSAFFCRRGLIDSLLHSNENCDWVIGKRRIGKTSLLRQMEYLVNGEKQPRFALFWDIQGSYDAEGLAEGLIDAIEDSRDEYPEKWDGVSFEVDEGSCLQTLKRMVRAFSRQGFSLLLLIDEAEEFITIGKQNPTVLGKLRKLFQNNHHLRTIISSTPRLEQLHKTIETETSPFLHGFHAVYLGNFLPESCRELLRLGIQDQDVIQTIMTKTDGNPFETQLVAKHYFGSPDLDDVLMQLEANPSLKQVIDVNFELLTPDEQDLLKDVFSGKSHMDKFALPSDKAMLSKLLQLGYLVSDNGVLRVGSYFQAQWLSTKLDASPSFHAQHESDPYLTREHPNLILKNVLIFYKFFLELAQENRRLAHFENSFKISAIDQSVYPDRTKLNYQAREQGLSAWQQAVKETVSLLRFFLPKIENWSIYRFFQMAEAEPGHYSENEFLDLMMLIAEEAQIQ